MASYESTILITGGTSGLGYYAALSLARSQPNILILIASRTDPDSAAAAINKATGHSNCQYIPLDLGSLAAVRIFIDIYGTKSYPPVSGLLLNAGLQFAGPPSYTSDDIEKTFAINHVGHALLFHLTTPHLTRTARIVLTASGVHDPAQKTGMPAAFYPATAAALARPTSALALTNGRQQYSNSKLANVLWTYALARRLKQQGRRWTATALDPGFMPGTGLARDAGPVLRFVFVRVLPSLLPLLRMVMGKNVHAPRESGEALARLAVGGDVEGVSGKYFEGREEIESSKESYVVEKQEDLWRWTLDAVSRDEAEKTVFEKL